MKAEAEFAELVVREFLQRHGFSRTIQALNEEVKEKGSQETPEASSWYQVSESIRLAELILTHKSNEQSEDNTCILEIMTTALKEQAAHRIRQQPLIRVIRTSPNGGQIEVGGTESIFSTTPSITSDLSKTGGHTLTEVRRRTQAATAVATEDDQKSAIIADHKGTSQSSPKKRASTDHAILPLSPSFRKMLGGTRSSSTSPQRRNNNKVTIKRGSVAVHNNKHTSNNAMSRTRRSTLTVPEERSNDGPSLIRRVYRPIDFAERKMAERSLKSGEYWIPMSTRSKMLMRDLRILKMNVQEQKACWDAINRHSKYWNVTELDHNKTQERLGAKHQKRCGLCTYQFSEINLCLIVPSKAIMDLRQSWMNRRPECTHAEASATIGPLKAPMFYDTVGVCVFCAQFLQRQDLYRPSLETQEQAKRERTRKEAKRALWWDPLRVMEEERNKTIAQVEEKQAARCKSMSSLVALARAASA